MPAINTGSGARAAQPTKKKLVATWIPLPTASKDLAAQLPAAISSALNDRDTGFDRGYLETNLDEIWLLVDAHRVRGFANFHAANGTQPAIITHAWLYPDARRQGALTRVWPLWRQHYGNFAGLPNDAMDGFYASQRAASPDTETPRHAAATKFTTARP